MRLLTWIGTAALLCGAGACTTFEIVRGFNDGTHRTTWDTTLAPSEGRTRMVRSMVHTWTAGAYFAQGPGGPGPFDAHEAVSSCFGALLEEEASATDVAGSDEAVTLLSEPRVKAPCDRAFSADLAVADRVRGRLALANAATIARAWRREGLADLPAIQRGFEQGVEDTRAYLRNRRWSREAASPVRALVVSGGSSNGMFGAGAVWLALSVLFNAERDAARTTTTRAPSTRRFALLSGTSAGAMSALAADLFDAQLDDAIRTNSEPGALENIKEWFTCLGAEQLYCVEAGPTTELFESRSGLARFDGVRDVMHKALCATRSLENPSELLLNTVDFQSGELLALSDQDPGETLSRDDVEDHALASIPLPLIAKPWPVERVSGTRRPGFYLDGGVRSTLPLLPVVQRGAERVLLVSSLPSTIPAHAAPKNALDLLRRYIDIESGHTIEEGVAFAQALARLRDEQECQMLEKEGAGEQCAKAGSPHAFRVHSIFRNEALVPEAAGYSFNPKESLPLFLAGAAAARAQCAELLDLFGLPPDRKDLCRVPLPDQHVCDRAYRPFREAVVGELRACPAEDAPAHAAGTDSCASEGASARSTPVIAPAQAGDVGVKP